MGKFITWLGGSTTSRFGVSGFLIALILFAFPSVFYFLTEGGVVMPSSVGIIVGIILIFLALGALVFLCILWRVWVKDGLLDTTHQGIVSIEQRLTNLESAIDNLVDEIRNPQRGSSSKLLRQKRQLPQK